MLADCSGGSQSQLAPSAPFRQSSAQPPLGQLAGAGVNTAGGLPSARIVPLHYPPNPGRPWMSPDAAKTKDLLYVSNIDSNTVNVYSYPADKPMGNADGRPFPYAGLISVNGMLYGTTGFGGQRTGHYKFGHGTVGL
jgi:hypothetical protein